MTHLAATTDTEPLGDPVPAILTAYYEAIDTNRFEDAAATFALRGLYAVPQPDAPETAPRVQTIGPANLLDRFANRGSKPWHHVVRLCVGEGPDALLEGVLADDRDLPIATFVASARINSDGLLDRYLTFACVGARDPIPTDLHPTATRADAARVVHQYFRDLDAAPHSTKGPLAQAAIGA